VATLAIAGLASVALATLACANGAVADASSPTDPSAPASGTPLVTPDPSASATPTPEPTPSATPTLPPPVPPTPPVVVVPPAPKTMTTPTVRVTGTLRVGQTLKATYTKTQATKVAAQWYRGTTAIKGATKLTYKTVAADSNAKLRVLLTFSATGYKSHALYTPYVKVAKIPAGVDARCMTTGKVMCASKSQHKLRFLNNGVVQLTTAVTFGRPSLPTVNGVFKVWYKSRYAYSHEYHASMPYAMFFHDGYAVHYDPPTLSHGCIHVWHLKDVQWLWNHVSVGTTVVVG